MSQYNQGSKEWHDLRRRKVGASDAAVILGISPYKRHNRALTPHLLWEEKMGMLDSFEPTPAMQRGIDLEPAARLKFEQMTGFEMFPQVVFHKEHEWMMASMDGLTLDGNVGVEIKCNGPANHQLAHDGEVPAHYYAQLQHQMACCELSSMYYFSFDGENGILIEVDRDNDYIKDLIAKEAEFYSYVESALPPPLSDKDVIKRTDAHFLQLTERAREINAELSRLQAEFTQVKSAMIEAAGDQSCDAPGATLRKTYTRGPVQYSKIPELEAVDLEQYRAPTQERWTLRLTPVGGE